MGSGDAYDVFVSYARSDEAAAAELNGWLGDQGLRTFFDRSELRPGLRWVAALEDGIGRSRAVAILVGPHGIGNTQQYERELALIRQTQDAAFPASVRYLAADFGPDNIRVNAVSAGPIRTLAGAGVADARFMLNFQRAHSPLRRTVTIDDVGGAALYLLSSLSAGVTGEVLFVDAGYNIMSMPRANNIQE